MSVIKVSRRANVVITWLFEIYEVQISDGMQYPDRILLVMAGKNNCFKVAEINDNSRDCIEEESEIEVFRVR